jgi:hypothetical protein
MVVSKEYDHYIYVENIMKIFLHNYVNINITYIIR